VNPRHFSLAACALLLALAPAFAVACDEEKNSAQATATPEVMVAPEVPATPQVMVTPKVSCTVKTSEVTCTVKTTSEGCKSKMTVVISPPATPSNSEVQAPAQGASRHPHWSPGHLIERDSIRFTPRKDLQPPKPGNGLVTVSSREGARHHAPNPARPHKAKTKTTRKA